MKIKNKGKVYPSPSSSSSSASQSNDREVLSVLKLLPAAILALASVLSPEDREVLAYMITRSMKTSASSSSSSAAQESKSKSSKKAPNNNNGHKPPMFDCDCFDCYTSYWVRWDSSPNRELIHQVIEAFEDHLTHGEKSKKNPGRAKRRDKLGRREAQKLAEQVPAQSDVPVAPEAASLETAETSVVDVLASPENFVGPSTPPEIKDFDNNERIENDAVEVIEELPGVAEDMAVVLRTMAANEHKGLARKVLPDVLGLLNSRLWSLWSPNA